MGTGAGLRLSGTGKERGESPVGGIAPNRVIARSEFEVHR